MPPDHVIFDRALVRRRRARAADRLPRHDFLIERVADDLLERLAAVRRSFDRVLVLGSAGGRLASALGSMPGIELVLAADPVPTLARREGWPAVACDEELLPFAEASLDLVLAPLTLHLANDLPGVLAQLRRCLRPDGLLLASLFAGSTLAELRTALTVAEAERSGGASPRVAPFADLRDLADLLTRAGFALPVADTELLTVSYESPFALMRELRGMGQTSALVERSRIPLARGTLVRAAEIYGERWSGADGRIAASFEIVTLTAWSPHPDQPKPLRPGSASHRLAQALGGREQPAGERAGPAPRPGPDGEPG